MDLKLAVRRLRAAPVFTVFSIVTLACGIGVTTAVYSAVYAIGARPLGVAAPDRLAVLTRSNAMNRTAASGVSGAEFDALAAAAPRLGLAHAAAWLPVFGGVLAGPDLSEQVAAEAVTGAYFETTGLPIVHGRALTEADDREDAPLVLVLSDLAWRRQFDGSATAIGSHVRFGAREFEVVGIARFDVRGVGERLVGGTSAWIPLAHAASLATDAPFNRRDPAARRLSVVARLSPGVAIDAAASAVENLGRELDVSAPLPAPSVPAALPRVRSWALTPLDEANDFGGSEAMRMLMLFPMLVLLIACTNLANLVLSRNASRRHEYAIRGALGASRWRMLREALVESAIVVGAGGVLGVVVAQGLLTGAVATLREPVQAIAPEFPLDWRLDPVLLTGAGLSAVVALLVAGLFPALRMTRADPGRSLTTGDAAHQLPRWRGRSNLIALQIGVSAAMFLITMVMVRFLVFEPPRGFEWNPLARDVTMGELRVRSPAAATRAAGDTVAAVLDELRRQPAVAVAAATTYVPNGRGRGTRLGADLIDPTVPLPPSGRGDRGAALVGVTPDYFRTSGVPVLRGREFAANGSDAGALMIDEAAARATFGTIDVIGREVDVATTWGGNFRGAAVTPRRFTIIGVTPATLATEGPRQARQRYVYAALEHIPADRFMLVLRPKEQTGAPLVAEMRAAIRLVDRDLALGVAGRGDVMAENALLVMRSVAGALGGLATLSLVLACAGLYGVLSDVVTRRTRELGIRAALGAGTPRILRMILRQGLRPIAEGMFIGLGSALVIRQLMQFNLDAKLSAIDVLTFSMAALPLLVAGLVAALVPARRASRINPNVALRMR